MEEGPKPQVRLLDSLLELYVKIGGYIGVALCIGVFAGICALSYWLFHILNIGHIHSGMADTVMIIATLLVASSAAAFVFFWASVFWLPILISIGFICLMFQHILFKIHHLHS